MTLAINQNQSKKEKATMTIQLQSNTNNPINQYVASFRAFLKDPDNKPYYCSTYGTKYPGKVTFEHFVFYAMIKGKNPELTTHDINSERYQAILALFKRIGNKEVKAPASLGIPFGMSSEEVTEALTL